MFKNMERSGYEVSDVRGLFRPSVWEKGDTFSHDNLIPLSHIFSPHLLKLKNKILVMPVLGSKDIRRVQCSPQAP